jgi:LysR family transcriptional regulator, regulator for bpeEF and oprC
MDNRGVKPAMNQIAAMRVFVRLVETESFSRTATQLSMPRSTASKLIYDLEAHLGVRLVQRTTRQVSMTPEGLAYYEHVTRLLSELDEAENAIKAHGLRPKGRLRIDVPSTVARHLLIPALAGFSRAFPDIDVALGVSDRQVNIIGEGVDCVIRGGPVGDPLLVARRLMDLQFRTYASPLYLQRYGMPGHPAELREGHVVAAYFAPGSEHPTAMIFERDGERVDVEGAKFTTNDGEAHVALLQAGLGIGQHFAVFARPLVERGELVEILPGWGRPPFQLHLIYPPGKLRSARLSAFIDWMLEHSRNPE